MSLSSEAAAVEILLIEGDARDAELTLEMFRQAKVVNHVTCVGTAGEALAVLERRNGQLEAPTPDLILLDMHLPDMGGEDLLRQIKNEPLLAHIPVVVLTSREGGGDPTRAYALRANCYLVKPPSISDFRRLVESIDHFWLSMAELPPEP